MSNEELSREKAHLGFWEWFLHGTGDQPGWRNLIGWAILGELGASVLLASLIRKPLPDVATSVVLPVAGIAVALAFGWGAASLPLLTTKSVRLLGKKVPGGLSSYANYFQLVMLLILITLGGWAVVASGPFHTSLPIDVANWLAAFLLFFLTALCFVESWSVVDLSRSLFLASARLEDEFEDMEALVRSEVRSDLEIRLSEPSEESQHIAP